MHQTQFKTESLFCWGFKFFFLVSFFFLFVWGVWVFFWLGFLSIFSPFYLEKVMDHLILNL